MNTVSYCSPEWLAENATGYRANPRFQKELAKLTTKICFQIRAEPAWGIDKEITFCAHIRQGELDLLSFVSQEDAEREAEFILSATPQEWKRLLRKESKFVTDFMLGKVELVQGSKVGVLGIAPHANTFVDALTQHDLRFQDEMSPEELDHFRSCLNAYRSSSGV